MSLAPPRNRNVGQPSQAGSSLVELLVTCLVLTIMLLAVHRFLIGGYATYMFGQDNFQSQSKVELAQKNLDRALREASEVVAADPYGKYIGVLNDSDNNGVEELVLYFVDYTDGKLKEYRDETPYATESTYAFANPKTDPSLKETQIIADIVGAQPTTVQESLLSPNPQDSGRPFIFFSDDPQLSLDYNASLGGWQGPIKGVRTYFYVDVSPSTGAQAYALQTYVRFRNIE